MTTWLGACSSTADPPQIVEQFHTHRAKWCLLTNYNLYILLTLKAQTHVEVSEILYRDPSENPACVPGGGTCCPGTAENPSILQLIVALLLQSKIAGGDDLWINAADIRAEVRGKANAQRFLKEPLGGEGSPRERGSSKSGEGSGGSGKGKGKGKGRGRRVQLDLRAPPTVGGPATLRLLWDHDNVLLYWGGPQTTHEPDPHTFREQSWAVVVPPSFPIRLDEPDRPFESEQSVPSLTDDEDPDRLGEPPEATGPLRTCLYLDSLRGSGHLCDVYNASIDEFPSAEDNPDAEFINCVVKHINIDTYTPNMFTERTGYTPLDALDAAATELNILLDPLVVSLGLTPRVLGAWRLGDHLLIALEDVGCRLSKFNRSESGRDLPAATREAVRDAYRRLHRAGVVQGDVALRHVRADAEGKIRVIDFEAGRLFDDPDAPEAQALMAREMGEVVEMLGLGAEAGGGA